MVSYVQNFLNTLNFLHYYDLNLEYQLLIQFLFYIYSIVIPKSEHPGNPPYSIKNVSFVY
jgi:hypothetical protein